jgi:hypothetical protein
MTSNKIYVIVKPDASQDKELAAFLDQNYPKSYSIVPEANTDTIPASTHFVSSMQFNGNKKFLDAFYAACAKDDALASNMLLSELEEQLSLSNFSYVDTLLTLLDVDRMTSRTILGALSLTWHGKKDLLCRDSFIKRSRFRLECLLGTERTAKLLKGRI